MPINKVQKSMEEERQAFLDHINMLIGYWNSEKGSNVLPETSKREALEGLAFSIMVVLDGEAVAVGPYKVCAITDDGKFAGPDIAGDLHNLIHKDRVKGST